MIVTGCAGNAEFTVTPAQAPTIPPTDAAVAPTPEQAHVTDPSVLYHDDFTNPSTAWPEEKFDNFFIGYHEPEYYHVEISSPNYKATVFEPGKKSYGDVTIEVGAFTASSKTAETGDFSFGLVFRRSGDQYYAFTISQRTRKWYLLKSTPNALTVLAEGADEGIHDPDAEDLLRVDARGANFAFRINDQLVGQVTDADYVSGEVGLFVQTFDIANAHVHFDELTIRNYDGPPSQGATLALYHDDFTNPATAWPEEKFDNFFIGYHEPEFYHIEISSPNYKTTVFEPGKGNFADVTIEARVFTASSKTAETGDFSFGLVFRRSGDQYYAFAISQRAKNWYVLKSTPNALVILAEGSSEGIHDPDVEDVLRVDAQGSGFSFHINDRLVSRVTDPDYTSGEVGFFVQTFDVANAHIHFDELTVSPLKIVVTCEVKAQALNVRSGPGTDYSSKNIFLSYGDTIEPIGRNAEGDWLLVTLDENENQGWISNSSEFLSCNEAVDVLPVQPP
jgi:hypothetical protein